MNYIKTLFSGCCGLRDGKQVPRAGAESASTQYFQKSGKASFISETPTFGPKTCEERVLKTNTDALIAHKLHQQIKNTSSLTDNKHLAPNSRILSLKSKELGASASHNEKSTLSSSTAQARQKIAGPAASQRKFPTLAPPDKYKSGQKRFTDQLSTQYVHSLPVELRKKYQNMLMGISNLPATTAPGKTQRR